jgi:hypothetical protein
MSGEACARPSRNKDSQASPRGEDCGGKNECFLLTLPLWASVPCIVLWYTVGPLLRPHEEGTEMNRMVSI